MHKIENNIWLGPVISGILSFVAICQINFWFSWVCYIPLFISITSAATKATFKKGFIYGATFSVLAFFWMIPGAERFTGSSILYGIGVFLISALFISLFYGSLLYCFAKVKVNSNYPYAIVVNCILIASLFCVCEALLTIVSTGFPWFDIHSGNGLAANDFSIQPASLFGIHILTFITVLVNYLFAYFIVNKVWVKLSIPIALVAVYLIAGYFLLINFQKNIGSNKSFSVAILAENIPPEIKWDANTGNVLVQKLLDLNHNAVALKPNMALWSESAIPWTYKKDDDLVKEVLSITSAAQITHILGINTEYKDNIVFNSAYCIRPNGDATERYDKQYLLSVIEKPLGALLLPFFSSAGFVATSSQQHAAPLNTPYGKAGVLICNEAAVPTAAADMVKQGAQFLFNMSNDGWFNDTYIVRLHYYYARLRAVESRKDLAINSNNGYSGMIKASGAIVEQERSEDPFVKMVSMQPNNMTTIASAFPTLFVYCCTAFLAFIGAFGFFNRSKK